MQEPTDFQCIKTGTAPLAEERRGPLGGEDIEWREGTSFRVNIVIQIVITWTSDYRLQTIDRCSLHSADVMTGESVRLFINLLLNNIYRNTGPGSFTDL